MKKTETGIIGLIFLVLFGATCLSFFAYWIITAPFPDLLALFVRLLLFYMLVFFYCFATTAWMPRTTQGYIVSPLAVWGFVWLMNLVAHLYGTAGSVEFSSEFFNNLIFANLMALLVVSYAGLSEQFFVRKLVGFMGNEEAYYFKSYISSNKYEEIVDTLTEKNWFYDIYRLRVRKHIKSDILKIKAYDNRRKCYAFFLVKKKDDNKTIINLVSYVKNATNFASFIHIPDWCRELVDNITQAIEQKGMNLSENGLELKREALDYALAEVKPLVSLEKLRRLSLPLFVLAILVMVSSAAYFMLKMKLELAIAIASVVLTFLVFMFQYYRKS